MQYRFSEIAAAVTGQAHISNPSAEVIEHLLLDSRQIIFPELALFFAIPGIRNNGHDFIPACYQAGVRNFVVSEPVDYTIYPLGNFLLVKNTVEALQQLALHHRQRFQLPVIGITGSNGKTIVKEWLFQLLHPDYAIVRSPRSYNSQAGVPLSVWEINPKHQLGIFEAGISHAGEMPPLAAIIRCNLGVFTNLGAAHREGFASEAQKLQEKLLLFQHCDCVVYCRDDEKVDAAIHALAKPSLTWSKNGHPADLSIQSIYLNGQQANITADFRGAASQITLPFNDAISIENALHCWAVLLHFGLDPLVIRERMLRLEPVAMRLELKEGGKDCILVNDSYSADFTSLKLALQFLNQNAQGRSQTLIITDILQSGEPPKILFEKIAQLIQQQAINRVIGIGKEAALLRQFLPSHIRQHFFDHTEALLQALPALDFAYEAILLKGARTFGLERVADVLSRQVHQTILEINLSAMSHNLRAYSRALQPGVRLMAMVKASAYGAGSKEVARLLELLRTDCFCVAYADEGAELREAGILTPILVLNPEPGAFEQMLRHQLEPKVYSIRQLQELTNFLAHRNAMLPIHLSIDTGMHRLGFDQHEIEPLCAFLRERPDLEVRSVFSHLAASEDPQHDDFTHEQARRFAHAYEQLIAVLGYRPIRHLLNSNGITRFPQYQMDMVRLGIGLYGIDVSNTLPEPLEIVFSLHATISQIKDIAPGETIGYGRRAKAEKPLRSATISIGYADGLPRAAGNGRFSVMVHDQMAPILGGVCMDMCMIDVTHIPKAAEGDRVTIFGKTPQIEHLAEAAGTIPYELFTGIAPRVKRVYVQE
jgi:alanine racemase